MGNCQAADAAAVIIQHQGGKVEKLYWPTTAEDVMKSNPGYHVALVTLYVSQQQEINNQTDTTNGVANTIRFTRVRLLKPKDMLLLGQVYRLITNQEVEKAIKARKLEKMMKLQQQKQQKQNISRADYHDAETVEDGKHDDMQRRKEITKQETNRNHQSSSTHSSSGRKSRHWHPSLQSISESTT